MFYLITARLRACCAYLRNKTLILRKVRREHGEHHEPVDVKRVNWKVVQKYLGYPGKTLNQKTEIETENNKNACFTHAK